MSRPATEYSIEGPLPIPQRIVTGILRTAREAGQEEACGLLLGREREVLAWVPCRNAHTDPRRSFLLHPQDLREAIELAERLALDVLGSWHSHPRGPAQLSVEDRVGAPDHWLHWLVAPNRT